MRVIRDNKILYSSATGITTPVKTTTPVVAPNAPVGTRIPVVPSAPIKNIPTSVPLTSPAPTSPAPTSTPTSTPTRSNPTGTTQTSPNPTYVPPADTTPPAGPNSVNANALNGSQVNLSWGVASDNVGVTGYEIYRNGTLISTQNTTTYTDSGLNPSTTYTYKVIAKDAAGNKSTGSQVSVTTLASLVGAPGSSGGGIGGGMGDSGSYDSGSYDSGSVNNGMGDSGVVTNEAQNPTQSSQDNKDVKSTTSTKDGSKPTDVKGVGNEGKEEVKKGLLVDFTAPQKAIVVVGFGILLFLAYKKFVKKGK